MGWSRQESGFQVGATQRYALFEGPLESLSFDRCTEAAGSAQVDPPAGSALRGVPHREVGLVEDHPVKKTFDLFFATAHTSPDGVHGRVAHCSVPIAQLGSGLGLFEGIQLGASLILFGHIVVCRRFNLASLLDADAGHIADAREVGLFHDVFHRGEAGQLK